MKQILFVGTVENRKYLRNDIDDDMPGLINCDGTPYIQDSELSDLENNKTKLFKFFKNLFNSTFNYCTVDPSYSNEKKKDQDDTSYLGHYSCLLHELPNELNNTFDSIVITNCYQDFFSEININKLNCLLQNNNTIYIHSKVPYIITKYMETQLNCIYL